MIFSVVLVANFTDVFCKHRKTNFDSGVYCDPDHGHVITEMIKYLTVFARFLLLFVVRLSNLLAAPFRRTMRSLNGVEEVSSVLPNRCCRGVLGCLRWLLRAVLKLWTFCTTSLLILFLLYWVYGSVPALLLLIASVIG